MIEKIKPIDSLRGIASLLVAIIWHYGHFGVEFPLKIGGWVKRDGWLLVDLFFMLSGYIFMYVYKDAILNQTISFKKYFINRISRLYPLHILTLILVIILQSIFLIYNENCFMYQNFNVYHFLLNIFFVQKGFFDSGYSFNGPAWSISIEMVGYLLFFYILSVSNKQKIKYGFAFLAMVFIGLTIQKHQIDWVLFNPSTSRLFISFFAGCLLFEVNTWLKIQKKKSLILAILGISFILFLILKDRFGSKILGDSNVYTLYIFPTIILLSINISILEKALSNRVTTFLGEISFTLYLIHFPIQLAIICSNIIFELNIDFASKYFLVFYGCLISQPSKSLGLEFRQYCIGKHQRRFPR